MKCEWLLCFTSLRAVSVICSRIFYLWFCKRMQTFQYLVPKFKLDLMNLEFGFTEIVVPWFFLFKSLFSTEYYQFFIERCSVDPARIYLLKVNNKDTRTTPEVILVSLLLTLNKFHTLLYVSIVNFKHVIAGWEKNFEQKNT